MILYTYVPERESTRSPLLDLLLQDPASLLQPFDIPVPGAKVPQLGALARALIGTALQQPERPWGWVTELAQRLRVSRQTLYTIAARVQEGVLVRPPGRPTAAEVLVVPDPPVAPQSVTVTTNRLQRTVLTNLLPGGMAIRPQQASLEAALATSRSVGWLSELILEAGKRAGDKLDEIDLTPLGPVVTARDELYFEQWAFLLHVEPRHFVIASGYVEPSCDAETWGVALQLDYHTRGLQLVGLAEDGARMYPASLRAAELDVPVQKDVWHIERKARQAVTDLERSAWRALTHADDLFQQVLKDDAENDPVRVAEWADADATAEDLIDLSHEVRTLYGHLCDALELVDWRSGEIRDRALNSWLLAEVLQHLRQLPHPRVAKLVTYLTGQQAEMLTFLDWLELQLVPWQRQAARLIPDPDQRQFFQATVARAWRWQRAVANGHASFRAAAACATDLLVELLREAPHWLPLAEALCNILEGVVRTSCAAEAVNSVLRPYLTLKRSFQSRATAQAWLNLFCLWFNMHPLQRSKRRRGKQPMSPYQYAGIHVYTDTGQETRDWLEAIGYPPDA